MTNSGDKPSKVKVYGDGLNSGWRNKHNSIFVDFRDSGLGELSLFVEGPSKAEVRDPRTEKFVRADQAIRSVPIGPIRSKRSVDPWLKFQCAKKNMEYQKLTMSVLKVENINFIFGLTLKIFPVHHFKFVLYNKYSNVQFLKQILFRLGHM